VRLYLEDCIHFCAPPYKKGTAAISAEGHKAGYGARAQDVQGEAQGAWFLQTQEEKRLKRELIVYHHLIGRLEKTESDFSQR